jgi:hypothetical protein
VGSNPAIPTNKIKEFLLIVARDAATMAGGYLSQSASQQQDEQDEQDDPAETSADSRAAPVKPATAE